MGSGENRLGVRPPQPGAVALDAGDDIGDAFGFFLEVGSQGGVKFFFDLAQLVEREKVIGAAAVGKLDQRVEIVRLDRQQVPVVRHENRDPLAIIKVGLF